MKIVFLFGEQKGTERPNERRERALKIASSHSIVCRRAVHDIIVSRASRCAQIRPEPVW